MQKKTTPDANPADSALVRLLLVDDEAALRDPLATYLERQGFAVAQAGNDALGGLRLELAGAQGFHSFLRRRRRFPPPRLDAALAQEAFEHFLLVGRQRFGIRQNAV